ncbi:MAG: hypothetical protein ACR2JC_05360 [Chloroflexota bacterium]|nr:MAG: hypothetical protein DLM70_18790 [Chloroflexota bacterium]
MRHPRLVLTLALIGLSGAGSSLVAHAASRRSSSVLVAFVRQDNVWVARADGGAARRLTGDGTGTRIVNGRQVTYAYLAWSPTQTRLLVARFESNSSPGSPYRQGWSVETWTSGSSKFLRLVTNVNSQDFVPQWSSDGRKISYMSSSRYDDKSTMFKNTVKAADLSGRIAGLTRFKAREGCLDASTDPSELTFWNLVGPGGIRQTFIWSSAGRFVVYSTECIHTGLTYRSLAGGPERLVGRWMIEAVLSPNGGRLIGVDRRGLVLSNVDGSARRLFSGTAAARLPVWSPDGRFVYYMARRTLQTLHYHDRAGNLFEIQVNRSSIDRLDLVSGRVQAILTLPVHAFANLAVSADGRWLYFTEISNSDQLYRHLVGAPKVTNAMLTQYGPTTNTLRISTGGGRSQVVARDAGQIAVSNTGG